MSTVPKVGRYYSLRISQINQTFAVVAANGFSYARPTERSATAAPRDRLDGGTDKGSEKNKRQQGLWKSGALGFLCICLWVNLGHYNY